MPEGASIFPTSVEINGIRVEELAEFEIRLQRGTDPAEFNIAVSDDRFATLSNPVTITVRAPAPNLRDEKKLDLLNWHCVMARDLDVGRRAFTFVDARWLANFNKFTGYFNMKWANGSKWTRQDGTVGEWTCVEAAEFAMREFGLEPDSLNHDISIEATSVILPYNLGNTPEGGFAAASMSEVMPALLEPIRADMVMLPNGKCRIVGRSLSNSNPGAGGNIFALNNNTMVAGAVGPRDISWQIPTRIVCQFRQKMERVWYFEEDDSRNTGRPAIVKNLGSIVNVALKPDTTNDGTGVMTYGEFAQVVSDSLKGDKSPAGVIEQIRKFWLRDRIFKESDSLAALVGTQQALDRIDEAEHIAQAHWRKTFRPKWTEVEDDFGQRAFSYIRLGRLGLDGSTKGSGSVLADYTTVFDNVRDPGRIDLAGDQPMILSGDLSTSVFFAVAPFQAIWADENEYVFSLVPRVMSRGVGKCHLGLLERAIGFRTYPDVTSGMEVVHPTYRDGAPFTNVFRLAIFWNGIVNRPILGFPRLHSIDGEFDPPPVPGGVGGLPPGGTGGTSIVPAVYVPVDDLTANWVVPPESLAAITGNQRANKYKAVAEGGSFPGNLINAAELASRANEVAKQIAQSFKQDYSGVATCGGIHCITDGNVTVSGPIHECVIQIGASDPWAITTHYQVIPEFRPGYAEVRKLDGVAPEKVI